MVRYAIRPPEPTVLIAGSTAGQSPCGSFLGIATARLESWGYRTEVVSGERELSAKMTLNSPALVLLDLGDSCDNLELLEHLSKSHRATPVIVMSSHATITLAVQATKLGAINVVPNPPDLHQLRVIIDGVVKERIARRSSIDHETARGCDDFKMLGQSQAILDVLDLVRDVAETDATVLILGESGTGKELLARAIHACSRRSKQSFVPVNVATLPATIAESILFGHERGSFTGADSANKGWCETANGGTLMLDEIGEMDIVLQAKLLRFLQDGTFMRVGSNKAQTADVRIIAAMNRAPEGMVNSGRMREDLYYRLNVFPICMPPLRLRREDIPLLATAFLEASAATHQRHVVGFTDDAMSCLIQYEWPGNVRQLENLVTRMVLLARESYIGTNNVPPEIRVSSSRTTSFGIQELGLSQMENVEKQAIITALTETNGNAVAAAKRLGLGQATIYRKIKRFEIDLQIIKSRTVTTA